MGSGKSSISFYKQNGTLVTVVYLGRVQSVQLGLELFSLQLILVLLLLRPEIM